MHAYTLHVNPFVVCYWLLSHIPLLMMKYGAHYEVEVGGLYTPVWWVSLSFSEKEIQNFFFEQPHPSHDFDSVKAVSN